MRRLSKRRSHPSETALVNDSGDMALLRSRSVPDGEATLKGIGKSPSQAEAEKAEDQP
ncbi:MAG: hypothetical protein HC852_16350 [Acaryochloridaceae cyanobacterium RU_4_10]|nr:hypothetical protein [Acaryochloridaceae cyanobacterium RU_4_10]